MEKLANTRRELEAVAAGQPPIVPGRARSCPVVPGRARSCLIKPQSC
jgi:hypothetical protein